MPVRGPRIEILDSNGKAKSPKTQEISYSVGDKIELRCNSAPSKPAARLRWYLNDVELNIPNGGSSSMNNITTTTTNNTTQRIRRSSYPLIAGYELEVSPIKYQQHYKSIYSSHSKLSLILQRNNLINNKISFKCLASMRQEIPLQSKKLILVPFNEEQQQSPLVARRSNLNQRAKRDQQQQQRIPQQHPDLVKLSSKANEAHPVQRRAGPVQLPSTTRSSSQSHSWPHHHHHHATALHKEGSRYDGMDDKDTLISTNHQLKQFPSNKIGNYAHESVLYVYESPDSILGPTLLNQIHSAHVPEELSSNSARTTTTTTPAIIDQISSTLYGRFDINRNNQNNRASSNIKPFGTSRLDNVELISRQRTLLSTNNRPIHHYRSHGLNSLVKAPLIFDELDPMRPVINWPPLESGRLISINGTILVALPNLPFSQEGENGNGQTLKVSLAPSLGVDIRGASSRTIGSSLIEQLLQNLNCTCTDGSIDTKLGWTINEVPVELRETRYYPTKISSDHRQTILTIGFNPNDIRNYEEYIRRVSSEQYQSAKPSTMSAKLESILAKQSTNYLDPDNQVKLSCIATHSMLLYSSSETITFDFSPSQSSQQDGNSILEKLASSPSDNVIQATSGM